VTGRIVDVAMTKIAWMYIQKYQIFTRELFVSFIYENENEILVANQPSSDVPFTDRLHVDLLHDIPSCCTTIPSSSRRDTHITPTV
jgi:hypothetical protein